MSMSEWKKKDRELSELAKAASRGELHPDVARDPGYNRVRRRKDKLNKDGTKKE